MKTSFVTVAAILLFQLHLYAQNMEQLVTIRYTDVPLEIILDELSDRYNIRFAFGASSSVLGEKITIAAVKQPLADFLSLLFDKVGLRYNVVGSHVVLSRKREEKSKDEKIAKSVVEMDWTDMDGKNIHHTFSDVVMERKSDTLARLNSMVPEELVTKDFLLSKVPVRVRQDTVANASRRQSNFLIAPFFSLDFLQLNLKSDYENNQHLDTGLNFSIGGGGSWKVSEGFAGTLHVLYREKDFILRYMLEMEQGPIGIPEKTKISLSYLEIPLGVNFILLRHNKVALYGAPEFFGSFLLRQEEKTWLDDGRLFNTTAMQGRLLANFLWGCRAAAGFSFALSNRLQFSLSPAYQYTANNLKDGPQQIRLQEWNIRSGLWITL